MFLKKGQVVASHVDYFPNKKLYDSSVINYWTHQVNFFNKVLYNNINKYHINIDYIYVVYNSRNNEHYINQVIIFKATTVIRSCHFKQTTLKYQTVLSHFVIYITVHYDIKNNKHYYHILQYKSRYYM